MEIVLKKLNEVHPYENNPRINDKAVEAVTKSIREFGFRQPIVVDSDGVIIAGHTRWKAALDMGLDKIPVHVANLTPEQVKAYRIADNKTGELADWDFDKLSVELADLSLDGFNLSMLGFSELELAKLMGNNIPLLNPDDAPDIPDVPASQRGKIYRLGSHRLICADSLVPENLRRLTGGKRANFVFTDPPYNMNYQSKSLGGIKNDRMAEAAFVSFILRSLIAMKTAITASASYYICMSAAEYPTVYHQFRKHGLRGRQIIWLKPSAGLGGQEYRPQYEVMLYGYMGSKQSRIWNAERSESDFWELDCPDSIMTRLDGETTVIEVGSGLETVQLLLDGRISGSAVFFSGETADIWKFSRPGGKYVHPTQKPVALVERALKNSSNPGDMVLDLFGGSGSTLIACEKTGRVAYLAELDEKYCDVIRRRWAEYVYGTGCDWQDVTPEVA